MDEMSPACERERPSALKRRKVRKGTKSCWECKRRKIRCTFVTPTELVCDGCRSRRVECIGQEFHKKATTIGNDRCCASTALDTQLIQKRPALFLNSWTGSIYEDLHRALLAVWPSQLDLDFISSLNVGTALLFHGTVCKSHSRVLSTNMPSPKEMLQPPPPGSHPVFIARNLLMLGSFLQGIPPEIVKNRGRRDARYHDTMSRVVEAASRLVTSNDNLVGSLEGIECIMIESMYQNNAGNLRDAWLANRRAMMLAQVMGLHQSNSPLPNLLDAETRDRIDPEYMWSRLVMSDRYLSLMLNLPQGSQESSFASPKALERCAPMERMERLEAYMPRFRRPPQDGIGAMALAAVLRSPALAVPIDQIPYQSVLSRGGEFLPLVVALVSSPGTDLFLLRTTLGSLEAFGRPTAVNSGKAMFDAKKRTSQ